MMVTRLLIPLRALQVILPIAAMTIAADAKAYTLERSGAWTVNHEPDGCRMSASFGQGRQTITAQFVRYQPGNAFELRLIGRSLGTPRATTITRLNFGLAGTDRAPTMVGVSGRQPLLLISYTRFDGWRRRDGSDDPPPISASQEAAVTALEFETGTSRRFQLRLGPMGRPMAALRACTDNLLAHWGYDPAVQGRLSRYAAPTNSPNTWLTPSDFPADALADDQSGIVHVRLDVGEGGEVLGCYVIAHTDPDAFSETTCRLIRERARMAPALDEQGAPIRSYYVTTVRWIG